MELILSAIVIGLIIFIIVDKVLSKNSNKNMENSLKSEITGLRSDINNNAMLNRQEINNLLIKNQESFLKQYANLSNSTEQRLESVRTTLQTSISQLNQENSRQLEQMRSVVDEKLQSTLEKRLNDSFSLVNQRLEQVYKGLGEMQTLASGVGDLKKVLQNVRTRGLWGEAQVSQILEQVMYSGQYETNVAVKPGSAERVEFALVLPGNEEKVYLPIDSKFPQEDYLRLVDASENGDPEGCTAALKQLSISMKKEAKDIAEKYIAPPYTTDFAIMFLPVEGLYAEVLRNTSLFEELQKMRIVVCGPTTLVAILNSLNVGFKTLAIEKRSSEVWRLLGGIKDEFGKFEAILVKTQKKLQEANNVISDAARKTRTITRKLKNVESLPDDSEFKLFDEEFYEESDKDDN